MANETQIITYKIQADNKQAVDAFAQLAKIQTGVTHSTEKLKNASQQSNMMLMSTGRIVQDLPFGIMGIGNNITFLAEQFQQAKTSGTSFKDAIKGMGVAMMGTGGLIMGLNILITTMTMLSRNTKTGESYTKDFIDTIIKGSSESEEYAKSIGMVTKALQSLTDETLRSRIQELTKDANSLWVGLTRVFNPSGFGETLFGLKQALLEQEQRDLKNSMGIGGTEQGIIQRLQTQIQINTELRDSSQSLTEQANYQKILNELQAQLNSHLGTTKDRLKDIKETIKEITGGEGQTTNRMSESMQASIFRSMGGRGNDIGDNSKAGMANVTQGFADQMNFINDQIRMSANLLSSEFKTAWEDIFGEANSLFEKFMMNIVSSLAELAAQNLLSGLLNFILPGAGTAAQAMKPQTIVVQVGDYELARAVVKGNREAQRLRIAN